MNFAKFLHAALVYLATAINPASFAKRLMLATGLSFCCFNANAESNEALRDTYMLYFRQTRSGVLAAFANLHQTLDRNGNGIDAGDIETYEMLAGVERRNNIPARWLRMDVNADLEVTEEEVKLIAGVAAQRNARSTSPIAAKRQIDQQIDDQLKPFRKADQDHDGALRGKELYSSGTGEENPNSRQSAALAELARQLIVADPNRDGQVTETETASLIVSSLTGIAEEAQAWDNLAKPKTEGQKLFTFCGSLPVVKSGKLVAVGTGMGTSLSTVSVSGQDNLTSSSVVKIEEGEEPITLILTSRSPVIWQLQGATHRIAQAILSSEFSAGSNGEVAAGVTGIPREKVIFYGPKGCLETLYPQQLGGDKTKALIERETKHSIDLIAGRMASSVVAIPSGHDPVGVLDLERVRAALRNAGLKLFTIDERAELTEVMPGKTGGYSELGDKLIKGAVAGIVEINPSAVVSQMKAEKYLLLPGLAGLAQLQVLGKIERLPAGSETEWKILGKVRFPAGLVSQSFFLPKDVQPPDGSTENNCIFAERLHGFVSDRPPCVKPK